MNTIYISFTIQHNIEFPWSMICSLKRTVFPFFKLLNSKLTMDSKVSKYVAGCSLLTLLLPLSFTFWHHHWHENKWQWAIMTQLCIYNAGLAKEEYIRERVQRRRIWLKQKRFWRIWMIILKIVLRMSHYAIIKFHF